ncbi:MAG: Slp family lipoprotein [Nitrospira sp.]|nr:Slp family lipoprotein [Nitrospira sp.]
MAIMKHVLLVGVIIQLVTATGCNTYRVIPPELQPVVNKNLSYDDAKTQSTRHLGQVVVWGGEVLKATREPHKTRIEVLQLPLNDDLVPAGEKVESSGRFLAIDTLGKLIDPAVLPVGTRITVIGQIRDPSAAQSDTANPTPVIDIRDMTVWDKQMRSTSFYPRYGPYYGYYYYGARPFSFWEGARVPGS